MTDWFSELNGAAPAGAAEAPQQRDWFSEINGGGIMQTAAPKPQAKPQQGWGEWAAELPLRGYKAVVGTQDPAYKDLKAFDDTPAAGAASTSSAIARRFSDSSSWSARSRSRARR